MAIADQALRFVHHFARSFRLVRTLTRLLIVSTTLCTVAVAGCAQNTAQQGLDSNRVHATVHARSHAHPRPRHHDVALRAPGDAQSRLRRLDPALLTPQPEPDCELDKSDAKTVDPDQWARLRLDYERQCYQKAEKMTRERLAQLQRAVDDMRR